MKKYVFGIDIGATNTCIGLVDDNGKVLIRTNLPTQNYDNSEIYLNDISAIIKKIMTDFGIIEIGGIGIGAPNANFSTGRIGKNTANLRMKEEIPICDFLKEKFNAKVVLSNDADAAALGEHIYGSAKNLDNFVLVTLGTGVGSGFFADGRLIHGENCLAGELGHSIIQPDGRKCSCGRKGCLETYTSARGICQTYGELRDKNSQSSEIHNITCKEIGDLANAGDPVALETFDKTAYWLSVGLANAATFSSPKAIILMGGPTLAGRPLMEPLKKYFDENILYIYKDSIDIRLSSLEANDAAILGAAALIHI